jgi:hypothetical protein
MNISGQETVTTAGSAEALGSQSIQAPLIVKALPTNTSPVYLGNVAGDVSASNGLALDPGEAVVLEWVSSLAALWLDAAVSGEGVSWLILSA